MTDAAPGSRAVKVFGFPAEKGRWWFVVIGLLIQLCLGAVYAWSVFKKPVQTLFQTDATGGSLPFILFLACFAVIMPFSGKWIQKYGPRKIGIIGGILVGIGWILSGFASNLVVLCLTYGVIAGAGVGLMYGAPIATSARWFPDRKGLAVGLTVGGFGLSAAIISPVGNALIGSSGVLEAFRLFGIVFLVLTALLSIPMRFPAADWKPAGWQPKAAASAARDYTPSQMSKTRSFASLWTCFLIGAIAGLMAIGISSPVGQEVVGISAATAATLVSVFAVFNFAGRPFFGWLTDRITPKNSASISFVLIALASIGMLVAGTGMTALYIVCFALLWLSLGGWLAIAPTATATFFGARNNSSNYGVVFLAYGVAAIIGNLISGRAKDIMGNYDVAFGITLALAIVGFGLSLFLLKSPVPAQEVERKKAPMAEVERA